MRLSCLPSSIRKTTPLPIVHGARGSTLPSPPPLLTYPSRTTDAETAGGPARANYKKQNNFLMKVIFDKRGECMYHVDCVLRAFKISKGRLKRLQERIKRELRGELTRHGLFGRPSNNRKKPETLRQFTDFVKANRIEANDEDGGAKVRYMLPSKITSIQGKENGEYLRPVWCKWFSALVWVFRSCTFTPAVLAGSVFARALAVALLDGVAWPLASSRSVMVFGRHVLTRPLLRTQAMRRALSRLSLTGTSWR